VVPVCKGLRLPKRPQPPQVPVNTPMSGSLHLSLSMVCLAYRIGECAELCTDGAPRAWDDKDVTNGTRPASVLLLSLGGRFLSLYCWVCAVCSDIARALLPKPLFTRVIRVRGRGYLRSSLLACVRERPVMRGIPSKVRSLGETHAPLDTFLRLTPCGRAQRVYAGRTTTKWMFSACLLSCGPCLRKRTRASCEY
jgi:hypothetical protein